MNMRRFVAVTVVVIVGGMQINLGGVGESLSVGENRLFAADKEKVFQLPSGDVVGFKGKGDTPFAIERTFPGAVGALLLTDAQKKQLSEARDETVGAENVREAGRKAKQDPNASAADLENAKNLRINAQSQLEQKVSNILTADQKALVAKISDAAREAQKSAYEALQSEFVGAKGNADRMAELQKQAREKAATEFTAKMAGILTAEQNAAYQQAAAQKEQEEKAKNSPKSK